MLRRLRPLTLLLLALIALLQYPQWLGKGSWLRVRDVGHQLEQQGALNAQFKARNDALDAEVRDLKQGFEAVEERARSELGMVKQDEIFFQILDEPRAAAVKADARPVPQ